MRAIYLSRFSLPFSRLMVVSRVSLSLILSHFLLFLLILLISILKNSSFHERQQERTFPSLSLSLLVLFRVGERKGASRHRFFEGDDGDDGFAGLSLLLRGTAKHR